MMLITEFVLSIVLYLTQWRLARAQTVICEPRAFCKEAWFCQHDDVNSCFRSSFGNPYLKINYDEGDGNDLRTRCYSFFFYQYNRCPSPETTSNILLKDLTLNFVSINPRYFKLTVSWFLNESSGHRGGYELRFTNHDDRISSCYCLGNSNKTRVTINNLRYEDWNGYKSIQLLSYPRRTENGMNVSHLLSPIRGCVDIQHNGTLCGNRRYSKPNNVTVESSWCGSENKSMRITWDPPSVASGVPLPSIYYIYLNTIPYNYRYRLLYSVRGTNEITLLNLIAAQNFRINIQPYRWCSGLGDATQNLGCGERAREFETRVGDCQFITK